MNMVVPDKKPMYSIPMRARATDNPIVSLKQIYTPMKMSQINTMTLKCLTANLSFHIHCLCSLLEGMLQRWAPAKAIKCRMFKKKCYMQ